MSAVPPVLVVDDVPAHAVATTSMLADAGHLTLVARDGDAALVRVRSQVVRLVVSEMDVPCADAGCVVAAPKQARARVAPPPDADAERRREA